MKKTSLLQSLLLTKTSGSQFTTSPATLCLKSLRRCHVAAKASVIQHCTALLWRYAIPAGKDHIIQVVQLQLLPL